MSEVSIKSGYEKPDSPTQLWVIDQLPGSDVGHTRPAFLAEIVAALGEIPDHVVEEAGRAVHNKSDSSPLHHPDFDVCNCKARSRDALKAALAAWAEE